MKFHFRAYKKEEGKSKQKHKKLIVDEYGYMGLTSKAKKGKGHKNIELKNNPNLKNKDPKMKSYLRKKIEYDKKKKFGNEIKYYQLHPEDKVIIENYVQKHKRKR